MSLRLSSGFVPSTLRPTLQIVSPVSTFTHPPYRSHEQQRTLLSASNETIASELEQSSFVQDNESIVDIVKKPFDWFFSSSLWTATLFLAPFISNSNLRQKLGDFASSPACAGFFILVASGYSLNNRVADIVAASDKKRDALVALRVTKGRQLSESGKVTKENLDMAVSSFEEALRTELALRVILPGLPRITAYLDPIDQKDDLAAIRQFLGSEINEAGELVPITSGKRE